MENIIADMYLTGSDWQVQQLVPHYWWGGQEPNKYNCDKEYEPSR